MSRQGGDREATGAAGTSSRGRLPGPRRGSRGGQIHGNVETGCTKSMGEEGLWRGLSRARASVHCGGKGREARRALVGARYGGTELGCQGRVGVLPLISWDVVWLWQKTLEAAGSVLCSHQGRPSWVGPGLHGRRPRHSGGPPTPTPGQLSQGWDVVWGARPPVSPVPELHTFCPQNPVTCWLLAAKRAGKPSVCSGHWPPSGESGHLGQPPVCLGICPALAPASGPWGEPM